MLPSLFGFPGLLGTQASWIGQRAWFRDFFFVCFLFPAFLRPQVSRPFWVPRPPSFPDLLGSQTSSIHKPSALPSLLDPPGSGPPGLLGSPGAGFLGLTPGFPSLLGSPALWAPRPHGTRGVLKSLGRGRGKRK